MKRSRVLQGFILGILLSCPAADGAAQTPGLPFLRLGADAHAAALAGAVTAAGSGLSALQANPAGIVLGDRHEAAFTHVRGFQDTDSEFMGFLWKRSANRAAAFSILSNNIGGIEYRSKPSVKPDGIISAHDFYAGLTLAAAFHTDWQVGFTARYLYQKIYFSSASGFAGDIGVRYAPAKRNISAGAVVKNVGRMGAFLSEKPAMPTLLRAGVSYLLNAGTSGVYSFRFSAEYETLLKGNNYVHFGTDFGYNRKYSLRIGYTAGFDEARFSAGAGLLVQRYGFDYAYLPDITPFGSRHIFTFRIVI